MAEASASSSRNLALRRCFGFRVDSADGHAGFVEEVLYGCDPEEPAALAVRFGLFHHRVEVVPLEAISKILASERRIVLRSVVPAIIVSKDGCE